ncbi:MAG: hypothetical protein HY801_15060, partial [Candidatus Lindowbacteria bacterium]|nr:hypothetical protein [Candidatus Lindowbacteria bacterium]
MTQKIIPETPRDSLGGSGRLKRNATAGVILACLALFIAINLRHFFEPFRDFGKPFSGEPFYAIRALNYLRHGYFTNWLGVCDDLNPHPDRLTFKFTEMPAYFIVNSLAFRFLGISSVSHGIVEMGYTTLLFLLVSSCAWKLFGGKTSIVTSIFMALIPVNLYLLYMAWIFVFPLAALFFYLLWHETRSRTCYALTITAVA